MSPAGQVSAHWALKVIIAGAPKPPKPPRPPAGPPGAAPASEAWYTKQQTCPLEQCCELEHESEEPEHEPADVHIGMGAKPPNPPSPGGPASADGADGGA